MDVLIASFSSPPPHIQPPIAHVPSAMRDARIEVPGKSTNSMSTGRDWTGLISNLLVPETRSSARRRARPGDARCEPGSPAAAGDAGRLLDLLERGHVAPTASAD